MTDFERKYAELCESSASGDVSSMILNIRTFNLNVNQQNSRGWTPLHFAARFGQKESVVTLIQFGASPQLKDSEGRTPLDLANFWGHEELAHLFKTSIEEPSKKFPENVKNFFSGNLLNRSSGKRKDRDWVAKLSTDASSQYLILSESKALLQSSKSKELGICWFKFKDIQEFSLTTATQIFLGLKEPEAIAHFAIDISTMSEDESKIEEIQKKLESSSRSFRHLRQSAFQLANGSEAAIIAQARSILDWNKKFQFCSICGSKTSQGEGGYKRECPNSKCLSNQSIDNTSYPRTDPVVIAAVLSKDQKRCLLGRSKNFPDGMYSCLSGFMEPGESIEEAVRREVFEETGVIVQSVVYQSSQPWPFPSQLMIGCIAQAATEEIKVDQEELEDAKWFTKEEISKALPLGFENPGSPKLPPRYAIAHQVLSSWVNASGFFASKL